jgi:hypothetical protein
MDVLNLEPVLSQELVWENVPKVAIKDANASYLLVERRSERSVAETKTAVETQYVERPDGGFKNASRKTFGKAI